MQSNQRLTHDLVLVGGGHAHALVLAKAAMRPIPGARITVINPAPTAPYTGMLPGLVAGHYTRAEVEIDLVKLAQSADARLVIGRATGLDRRQMRVHVAERADIAYDLASLDIGIASTMPELPGFVQHANPAKPLGPFSTSWEQFVEAVVRGQREARTVVIGGGVAGVEIALAMAWRLRGSTSEPISINVIEASDQILSEIRPLTRNLLLRRLKGLDVSIRCSARVAEIGDGHVLLSSGEVIACSFVAGTAGTRPHDWLEETGLEVHDGFVSVDKYLRSVSDPRIYACGDCAHFRHSPLEKAGVYAVRQAPVLWHNFCAELAGGARKPYRPQRDFLKLISTGGKHVVGEKFGIALSGDWLWKFKDVLDRRFMNRCTPVPPAILPTAVETVDDADGSRPGPELMCGGCGSKAGSESVRSALSGYKPVGRDDVLSRIGDDAAVLSANGGMQVITTDSLRIFTNDFWMHGRIAAVHALGDVWAMGAKPQSALATIVLPQMPERMVATTLREITEAAAEVFTREGAEIVGGHTCLGTDMIIGFSVTGTAAGRVVTKAGARPGDRLVLTKEIGSGTLLAGRMAGIANGQDIAVAENAMARSSGRAATILAPVANAMTDVSGYGLAGHIMEILEQSEVSARIALDRVPVLPGATALALAGIRSMIWRSNSRVATRMTVPRGNLPVLLFDPQTAGGLLASVPQDKCGETLEALLEARYPAAEIGEVTSGDPWIEVCRQDSI